MHMPPVRPGSGIDVAVAKLVGTKPQPPGGDPQWRSRIGVDVAVAKLEGTKP